MNQKLSLSFHQLRHFLAIADHGSLRAAAQYLGLSQPAISKSLKALEASLGTSLIERTPRGVRLTEVGELFLSRARLIENEIVRTADEIQALAGVGQGQVTIGASAVPSILLLPKAVASFSKQHPGADLKVMGGMPAVLLPRLLEGTLDFVVGPKPMGQLPDSIQAASLLCLKVNLVVRKGHPLEAASHLEDFAEAQWIASSNSSYAREAIQSMLERGNLRRAAPIIHVDSLYAVLSFIRSTDFVGIVPHLGDSGSLFGQDISVLNINDIDMSEDYQMFTRKNYQASSACTSLIASVFKEARLYQQATSKAGVIR